MTLKKTTHAYALLLANPGGPLIHASGLPLLFRLHPMIAFAIRGKVLQVKKQFTFRIVILLEIKVTSRVPFARDDGKSTACENLQLRTLASTVGEGTLTYRSMSCLTRDVAQLTRHPRPTRR